MEDAAELREALDRLHTALEEAALRGLRSAGPAELNRLANLRDEFRTAGAAQLAERLETTIDAVRADDSGAAAALLRTMVAARLFDRMLTLEVAAGMLSGPDAAGSDAAENGGEEEGVEEDGGP